MTTPRPKTPTTISAIAPSGSPLEFGLPAGTGVDDGTGTIKDVCASVMDADELPVREATGKVVDLIPVPERGFRLSGIRDHLISEPAVLVMVNVPPANVSAALSDAVTAK